MKTRRQFLALLGGAGATWPCSLLAQDQPEKPRRIVTLPDIHPSMYHVFSDAMREPGWMEGRDFIVVASGYEWGVMKGIDETVQRLIAEKPDLILAGTDQHAHVAHRATSSIPIVVCAGGYMVEDGLAESLSRPGKNVTGISGYASTELWSKLLQLLKEAKPDIKRIGILWTYVPPLSSTLRY
jgi:putative tryptophan/tyrosine transport system substrate-binding protein